MKKIGLAVLILALCSAPAYGANSVTLRNGSGEEIGTSTDPVNVEGTISPDPVLYKYIGSATNVKATPGTVYGFVGRATAATGRVIVADDTDTANSVNYVIDSGAAVSGDTIAIWLSEGVTTDTGIYVDVNSAVGTVYYE